MPDSKPVALVTGAGRGIGRAVAGRLSREGHRVVLTARSRDQLEETAAACVGETLVLPTDLTSADAIEDLFAQVEATWAAPAVLVANAGAGTAAPLHETTDEQWAAMLDLNLTAPFRCIRRAVPAMVDARIWPNEFVTFSGPPMSIASTPPLALMIVYGWLRRPISV